MDSSSVDYTGCISWGSVTDLNGISARGFVIHPLRSPEFLAGWLIQAFFSLEWGISPEVSHLESEENRVKLNKKATYSLPVPCMRLFRRLPETGQRAG
jgi:hypothetical protein